MHLKVESEADALNLSKLINDGNWMVLYYAEWCGHCKTMKPEWHKVVSNLSNSKTSNKINVAEIESEHIGKLLNKPDIEGFPTIKMYNNGKAVANFKDERVASKIEEFANNNIAKITKQINKINNVNTNKIKIDLKEINLNDIKTTQIQNDIKTTQIQNDIKNNKLPSSNEFKINNIIKFNNKIKNKSVKLKNNHEIKNEINILDLPCTSIRRAKPCKMNPKCLYDGSEFKCKDRIFIHKNNNILIQNKKQNKTIRRKHKHSKKTTSVYKHSKNNNIRKTTKSVFDQLIKSFGHIGNEAKKDSNLLKKASNKLV